MSLGSRVNFHCVELLPFLSLLFSFSVFCRTILPEEREIIVKEVNRIRRETQAPDMMEVVWNEELATIASGYASECNKFSNPTRSNQSIEFDTVGEVHYIGRLKDANLSFLSLMANAAIQWKNSKNHTKLLIEIHGNSSDSKICQNDMYAQITFPSASNIGCGMARCLTLQIDPYFVLFDYHYSDSYLIVCNFGPELSDECVSVIAQRDPCSSCPTGTFCNDGLCRKFNYNISHSLELCEVAQAPISSAETGGTEFYLTNWSLYHDLVVYVTTSEKNYITFNISDPSTSSLAVGQVKAGEIVKYSFIRPGIDYPIGLYQAKSITIKSPSKGLVVFGEFIFEGEETDESFLALPKKEAPHAAGNIRNNYTYIVVLDSVIPAVAIAATTDCTGVTIVTSKGVYFLNSFHPHSPSLSSVDFIFQAGDVLILKGISRHPKLNGTVIITSNKPLSVISGSDCGGVFSTGSPLGWCVVNFVIEQMPSVHEWGTRFAVSPVNLMYAKGHIRVISSQNDTFVSSNCSSQQLATDNMLQKGDWFDIQQNVNDYCWIEGNKGILVIQYVLHSFVMIVPPTEQYSNHYFLPAIQSRLPWGTDYVNVLIPKEHFQPHQIYLDGISLEDHGLQFIPIRDITGDVVVYTTVANFTDSSTPVHNLTHTNDFARFGVVMYGSDYGHPGGLYSYSTISEGGLPATEKMHSLKTGLFGVIIVPIVFLVVVGVLMIILIMRHRKKKFLQRSRVTMMLSVRFDNRSSAITGIADSWEMPKGSYQLEEEIGSGNYGSVYRGILQLSAVSATVKKYQQYMMSEGKSTVDVAVKRIKGHTSDDIESFLSEMEMMKKVSEGCNPHVVKMVGCVTLSSPASLLLEYVPHGNLRDYLRKYRPSALTVPNSENDDYEDEYSYNKIVTQASMSETDMVSFCYQIACGMEYLSSLNIIHRDLACRNVLVDDNNVLKISDFGLARKSEAYVSGMKDKLPLRWMAPETCSQALFTEHSDVWAYGVSLWEIYTYGEIPYSNLPNTVILPRILSGYRLNRPKMCPEEIYFIMEACWNEVSDLRPHFRELKVKFEDIIYQRVGDDYTTIIKTTVA